MLKLAFAGFRHGHVMGLYSGARTHPDVRVVAACEEDPATAESLRTAGEGRDHPYQLRLDARHASTADAIAVGDYFSKRGSLIIAALKAGKHVISDKPICTRLDRLDEIAATARDKNLRVGCLLDLRDSGLFIAARQMIAPEGSVRFSRSSSPPSTPCCSPPAPSGTSSPASMGGRLMTSLSMLSISFHG
jgi:predicted dehydrogenase